MSTKQLAPRELDRVFAALADPTRREILNRLGAGDATVNELAEPFPISLPAISRHLKVLEQAGLITRDRRAQWRSSSLDAAPLKEATSWMEHLTQLWDARFDRLDAHLEVMKRLQSQKHTDTTDDKDDDDD
jgi:DNA-binding transcriptional ArsR family regulator